MFFCICSNSSDDTFIAIDRYILEGKELEFYMKKLQKKKGKAAAA